jgi:hypothetical protein
MPGVSPISLLDLGRDDRDAAAADGVLAPPDIDEVTVRVERPEVARVGPVQSVSDSRVRSYLSRRPRKRLGPVARVIACSSSGVL